MRALHFGSVCSTVSTPFCGGAKSTSRRRPFVIILSLIVGIIGGLCCACSQDSDTFHIGGTDFASRHHRRQLSVFIYPVVGILITILFVKYVVRDNISHGVTKVLYAISQNKSRLKRHNMYSSLLRAL